MPELDKTDLNYVLDKLENRVYFIGIKYGL